VGDDKPLQLDGARSACYDTNADGTLAPRYPSFYVGGNPKGPNGTNFRYRIKLKPLGWFGSLFAPTDRFEKFKYFQTQ
jgi:hypothetical protein